MTVLSQHAVGFLKKKKKEERKWWGEEIENCGGTFLCRTKTALGMMVRLTGDENSLPSAAAGIEF